MVVRRNSLSWLVCSALALAPALASGQVLFSDAAFPAASYTSSSAGNADIRFGFNYATYDIFGDTFLVNSATSIPVAPRTTDGSRTGIFLSANNSTIAVAAESFASVIPNGVNVGTGTANPNYVVRVDVFHSTGVGIDPDGAGPLPIDALVGTTNYALVGLNQKNTTVQVRTLNSPGATGNLADQGLLLGVTADSGGAEDYIPLYGGAIYRDRPGAVIAGQQYTGTQAGVKTGLLGNQLNDYWVAQGLGFSLTQPPVTTPPTVNNTSLNEFTGDSLFFAPNPTNTAGYLSDGSGADKSPLADAFPLHSDPLHYARPSLAAPATLAANGAGEIDAGVPFNQWKTHELYWVDGEFTYVIDGTPVLQITPVEGANVIDDFSKSGAALLGFWDRFGGSVATSPEGANFVIYDNLEIAAATASQVPDMLTFLGAEGFLLPVAADDADFDGDGDVDGADFLTWQRGLGLSGAAATRAAGNANSDTVINAADLAIWRGQYGSAVPVAGAVPEPTSMALLASVAVFGLLARGRRFVG